jgi:uncharacterized repeat protein (TIGR01451 family)
VTHSTPTQARNAIIAAINEGRLLVNYIGHAYLSYWAAEQLLRIQDISVLTNADRLPLMVPMTCLEGYYIHPSPPGSDYSSFGEAIVRAAGRGAVASWSPAGMGVATGHDFLNRGLFLALFADDVIRLGPATTEAKLFLYSQTGLYRELLDTYLLLGDPATPLDVVPTDVAITKQVDPAGDVTPGDTLTYTLTFSNSGPATAHHVIITDLLPAALVGPAVEVTATVPITLRLGTEFAWDVADLGPGDGGVITITATVDEGYAGVIVNTATVNTTARESQVDNNTAAATSNSVPTGVIISWFDAVPAGNAILLRWETACEIDSLGFNLYRSRAPDGGYSRLNPALIPSQVPGSPGGALYTWPDRDVEIGATYYYQLEALDVGGGSTLHGPVSATVANVTIYLPLLTR